MEGFTKDYSVLRRYFPRPFDSSSTPQAGWRPNRLTMRMFVSFDLAAYSTILPERHGSSVCAAAWRKRIAAC